MKAKYDLIGKDYNNTRKADPYLFNKLLTYLKPMKIGQYLDIGCGTGNYTSAFQKMGYQFIGMDPSQRMLDKAKLNNPFVDWRLGTAENIALSDNSLDGIIATLTIHHWQNLEKGIAQLSRIMKPFARLVIFTSTPRQMQGYWLNHYFPVMMRDSMKQMPSLTAIQEAIDRQDLNILQLVPYDIKPDLQDHFLYCGKYNPSIYFNQKIQAGISSFIALANQDEVQKGLKNLKTDIANQHIQEIMQQFEHSKGDYLYIVAEKSNNI